MGVGHTLTVPSSCGFFVTGTSSVEVKENRNVGNLSLEDHTRASSDRQVFRCSDVSRSGVSGLKRKRPLEEGNTEHMHPKVQLKCKKLSWSVMPKNALVQLNELKPGLQYKVVSQTGPVHAPIFAIAVEVNGFLFEGTGPTKKKAKMRAAEMALQSFVQFPNASQAHFAMGNCVNPSADFTSDQADFPNTLFKEFEPSGQGDDLPCCRPADDDEEELLCGGWRRGRLLRRTLGLMAPAKQNRRKAPPATAAGAAAAAAAGGGKNPVERLNELRPGLRYVCLSETVEKRVKSFVMAARIDGRTFEGMGRSKKLAKAQTAQAALQALFNIQPVPSGKPCQMPGRNKCPHLPQVRICLADVGKLHTKFSWLISGNLHPHRLVGGGEVMQTNWEVLGPEHILTYIAFAATSQTNATFSLC